VTRLRISLLLLAGALVLGVLLARGWFPAPTEPGYRVAGEWGGTGSEAGRFDGPIGIGIAGGEVFVSDSRNGRIQVFDLSGTFLRELPVPGVRGGTRGRPMHLDVRSSKLFIPDYLSDRIIVMNLGGEILRTAGRSGRGSGELDAPSAVAVDGRGFLWVADFYNQRLEKLTPEGRFLSQLGTTGKKGVASGRFNYPTDLAFLADGSLVVADAYNDRVQVFTPNGDPFIKWGGPFAINIAGRWNGWFRTAIGLGVGRGDAIFVADMDNNRVQKFSAAGKFLVAIRAGFDRPIDVAEAPDGTLYVVDFGHDRVVRLEPVS